MAVPNTAARTAARLLGQPLPPDLRDARKLLSAAILETKERRRAAERAAATASTTAAALAVADHDIVIRSSPELRRLQEQGEDLRRRVHRARDRADGVMLNVAHWSTAVQGRTAEVAEGAIVDPSPPAGAADGDEVDPLAFPGVRKMRAAMDRFVVQRGHTNRIGADREADGEDDGEDEADGYDVTEVDR